MRKCLLKSIPIVFIAALLGVFLAGRSRAEDGQKKVYGLEAVLAAALEKNPSLRVFRANVAASRGALISSRAYPNPELEFGGSRGRSLETGETKGEYSIGLAQELEWPGKRSYRIKAARSEVKAAERGLDDLRLGIRAEVKKAFYRVLTERKVLEIAEDNLKTVRELLRSVQLRVSAGEAPEFELVKARVAALRAEKEKRRAVNVLLISKVSLNALLGNALPPGFDVAGEFSGRRTGYELGALIEHARKNHPQMLRARALSAKSGYALEEQKAARMPDLTVRGFYDKELDKESVGLGVSMPIPLWYRKKGEITSARAGLRMAETGLRRTEVELTKAVTSEYRSYLIALDQLDVFEKGLLKEAEEALRIADISYRNGESGLLDYLDAQRVYRSVLMEYYQSLFELEASLASLERVAGGLPE